MGISQNRGEILEPDKTCRQPKGVLALHRLQDRLAGRPKEENDCHRELRHQQQRGQYPAGKDNTTLD
jgi:hypothetical protein